MSSLLKDVEKFHFQFKIPRKARLGGIRINVIWTLHHDIESESESESENELEGGK